MYLTDPCLNKNITSALNLDLTDNYDYLCYIYQQRFLFSKATEK